MYLDRRATVFTGLFIPLGCTILLARLADRWWVIPVPMNLDRRTTVFTSLFIPLGCTILLAGLADRGWVVPVFANVHLGSTIIAGSGTPLCHVTGLLLVPSPSFYSCV